MKKEEQWKVIEFRKQQKENACQKFYNKLPYSITPLQLALFVISSISAPSPWKSRTSKQATKMTTNKKMIFIIMNFLKEGWKDCAKNMVSFSV